MSCSSSFPRATSIRRSLRRITATLCSTAFALTLAACGNTSSSGDTISFMLDWTPNTNHIGLYMAQEQGYYHDAGITVDILPTAQAGAEVSVENGVADVGFTTLSNVAAFDAQGSNLRFVFDLTQKPVARWCTLASRSDISTPKDLDGKTFVSFGSAEQTAVLQQMIKTAGGIGNFSTATAGTNTFETLASGKGDFAGFYATWENVEAELNGPALKCFNAEDWGVPGNPDQLGFAVNQSWLNDEAHQATLTKFIAATIKGYDYALAHPDDAATAMVSAAADAQLDESLVKASMKTITEQHYWTGDDDTSHVTGVTNLDQAQQYLDFQFKAGTYTDADGNAASTAPRASELSTNAYTGTKAA